MNDESTNSNDEIDTNEEILKVVEDAAPHKAKLDTTIAEKIRGVMEEYVHLKMRSDIVIHSIAVKKRKDRTPEEKEQLKEWMKQTKAEFKALKRFLFPTNPMSRPMVALAQKIALIVQMLRYIDVTDFDDALSQFGMKVEAKPLEETGSFWAKSENKDLAKDIFDQTRDVAVEEMNETVAIKEVKYNELPSELIYSPDNKSGMTVSQFTKLVKAKAVALVKGSEQYTRYKEQLLEKDEGALKSAEMTLEAAKEM